MEITLELLKKGKATIIKGIDYKSTQEYVEPFLKEMSRYNAKFIVNVSTPDQMTISGGDYDYTFNRVWIQAVLPTVNNGYRECYGLVYGIDLKTPIYKIYRAYLDENNNLCTFNPEWLKIYELIPDEDFQLPIEELMSMTSNYDVMIEKAKNSILDRDNRYELLGKMIELSTLGEIRNDGGKIKMSNGDVIDAYNMVYLDTTSKQFVADQQSSVLNYYNAFTTIIREAKKDIINRFEKTLLVNSYFGL